MCLEEKAPLHGKTGQEAMSKAEDYAGAASRPRA